ncbi:MAG: hypothetical protein SFU27_06475 [Thermonemataceae bacterium]|nr:hypothetical protein [Thermonemataceae bacterium]
MAALRNSDKWQVARAYWVYERLTQEEICEKLDIHPKTLISWRKQGGWDELRNYESNLVNKRLLLFTKLFELFENEISKESPNIDELLKIQTLIDKNTVKATSNAEMVQEVGLLWIRYLGENITEDGLKQVLLENYRDFAKWYINHIK